MPLTLLHQKKNSALPIKPAHSAGFSILELVVIVAGIATLTAIASTNFQAVFSDLENDEVQTHLNSLASECLKIHTKMMFSQHSMPSPTSTDNNLLNKNNYEQSPFNSCKYFQINPTEKNSKTHFSMGFGISNQKVIKFAIKDSANTGQIATACKSWAGNDNCLDHGNNYQSFFNHMDTVRKKQATCNLSLSKYIRENPNPPGGGNKKSWDANSSRDCKNKTLPDHASRNEYTRNCKSNGCTNQVKIKDGKIVGAGTNAGAEYQRYLANSRTEACDAAIQKYLENNQDKTEVLRFNECKDKSGNLAKIYICNGAQMERESAYETCEINTNIQKCTANMEKIRRERSGGAYIVGQYGMNIKGLPPCGQEVWIYNGVVHFEPKEK